MVLARTNYRKNTRALYPRHREPYDGNSGTSHAYGHASQFGIGLRVYDAQEEDRPAVVLVRTVEEAREIKAMLDTFLEATKPGDTCLSTKCKECECDDV